MIDVHAHVLHAEDIPLRAFGEKVLGLPKTLARLIERLLLGSGKAGARFNALRPAPKAVDERLTRELLSTMKEDLAGELRGLREPGAVEGLEARARDDDAGLFELLDGLLQMPKWDEGAPQAPDALRGKLELRSLGLDAEIAHCAPPSPSILETLVGVIRFAAILRKDSPTEVAGVYDDTFSDPAGTAYVDLLTPAMMSMERWLGEKSVHTIPQQIEELGQLVRESHGRVHPLFAFDPGESWSTSEKQLDRALALGFVGVKVYPPMGYLPIDNASHAPACPPLPCEAKTIDDNLVHLYEYCLAHDLPILAHCGKPGPAACDRALDNADPKNWSRVLELFPELRLCFGHFGGDELVKRQGWSTTIVELMRRYAHVYADVSFHDWAFAPESRACYVRALHGLLDGPDHALVGQRLLFGTDWSMIARMPWQDRYVAELLRLFEEEFPDLLDAIAGGNALDFLGLRDGAQNHQRLLDYYGSVPIDPKTVPWLQKL